MVEDTAAMVENAKEDDAGDAGGLSEGDGGEGGLEVMRGEERSGQEERSKDESVCGRACRRRKVVEVGRRRSLRNTT
ncbi:hypothetical protein L2E82_25309 [Cichorium intybus]|uniref:Uncharacterized protein n=1 Tax=Cichorium intybus TaxID=13427 RepID=A0ACB9E3G5_CICIN|nr:hypothetical protein L2E82_25309 [Cichorium intybus]